jgi:thiol:disulfide interchange protein
MCRDGRRSRRPRTAWSPIARKLAALRAAGTPVFVDMTADWCVTCKANEHTVLDTQAFQDLLKRTGAVYMKGDWTDVNPTISAFLQQYHSPGVPLVCGVSENGGPGQQAADRADALDGGSGTDGRRRSD